MPLTAQQANDAIDALGSNITLEQFQNIVNQVSTGAPISVTVHLFNGHAKFSMQSA